MVAAPPHSPFQKIPWGDDWRRGIDVGRSAALTNVLVSKTTGLTKLIHREVEHIRREIEARQAAERDGRKAGKA